MEQSDLQRVSMKIVWLMLVLPPLFLAVLIFAYIGLGQLDPASSASVEASAEVSWGFGSAEVSTSFETSEDISRGSATESSREEFAKNVSNATSKHAATASAKREVSVSASSEKTVEQQDTQEVIREIENVNSSHTLNFIFRQMNQEFYTLLHLIDVRLAASGHAPVSLAETDRLLESVLEEEHRLAVRKMIERELKAIRDYKGELHPGFISGGQDGSGEGEAQDGGSNANLRVKRDYASTYRDPVGDFQLQVPGVIINAQKNVMRTDGVMVEALLGQGIAIDEHAHNLQEAEALSKRLDNQIKAARLKILSEGDTQRADLYRMLFGPGGESDDESLKYRES